MSYRLEPGERVGAGLKRIVVEEIDSALEHIADGAEENRDEAIHETRKSIKRVRAILRLIRPRLPGLYRREMRNLREIAHELSDLRDAAAMVETFDLLANGAWRLSPIRRALVECRNAAVGDSAAAGVLQEAAGSFSKLKRRAEKWPLRMANIGALDPAIEKSGRQSRRMWKLARRHPDPVIWHEFRKKVKDQAYHSRLLADVAGGGDASREKQIGKLEEALGEDHNLVVLVDVLTSDPDRFGGGAAVAKAIDLIGRRQRRLRARSLLIAGKLYGDRKGLQVEDNGAN